MTSLKHKRSLEIAVATIVASLYAALVALLPAISFLAWQVRVADALLTLSMVLGKPAIAGVVLGCFIGNLTAPWGAAGLIAIDAVLGSLANLIASTAAYYIYRGRKGLRWKIVGTFIEISVVTVIVGTYLTYLLKWAFNVEIPLLVNWLGVFVGSVISIGVLGVPLAEALERAGLKHEV